MCHHIKPDSVDSYLSGICNQLEDIFPDIRANRSSRLVAKTLAGCKRLRGSAISRKHPITRDNLITVATALTRSSLHDDSLFLAMLLTGFHALLRLGELSFPDNSKLRDFRKVSSRNSVSWYADGYGYLLPTHKADKTFEGNKLYIAKRPGTVADPYQHFVKYLTSRDEVFPFHSHLWLRANGFIPTRSWFIRRLRSFFPNLAGQSMRAGGATALAEDGALPHIIQAAGRWASPTFSIYIRKNPFLLHAMIHSRPTAADS